MDAHQETIMACLGKTEATDLKASPEEIQSVSKHREVPKEHAAVKPVRGLRKRHKGQNLATEHCQKQKEQIQGSYGSQKNLTTTSMRMTHRTAQGT
jgi:hypothetical protein